MFRQGEYRNERLLGMCRSLPCQCQRVACDNSKVEASHSNQGAHGKGWARKSHDCFVAALGRTCHYAIDNGAQLSQEKRVRSWNAAWRATFAILDVTQRIVLPTIDLEEFVRVNGGQVLVPPDMPARISVLPGTVPDDVWLDYWMTGRAHVK